MAIPGRLSLDSFLPLDGRNLDDLKCPICLEVFHKPVLTKCFHRFCDSCLLDSFINTARNCPICRKEIDMVEIEPDVGFTIKIENTLVQCISCNKRVRLKDTSFHRELDCCAQVSCSKNKEQWTCPYCGMRIGSHLNIATHWNYCTKSNLTKCPICEYEVLQSQLVVHLTSCSVSVTNEDNGITPHDDPLHGSSSNGAFNMLLPAVAVGLGAVAIFLLRTLVFKF